VNPSGWAIGVKKRRGCIPPNLSQREDRGEQERELEIAGLNAKDLKSTKQEERIRAQTLHTAKGLGVSTS